MKLYQCLFEGNPCYKAGKTIQPQGIVVHSTAKDNRAVLDRAENAQREAITTARASGLSQEEVARIVTEVYADAKA